MEWKQTIFIDYIPKSILNTGKSIVIVFFHHNF